MSISREEIRWKFQNVLEMFSFTIILHENELETVKDRWNENSSSLITTRNNLIGAIGFGIGLWVGLMSLEVIPKETSPFIIIPIIIALSIFVGINIYLNHVNQKIFKLETLYQEHKIELIGIKSWVTGFGMREDATTQDIINILKFDSLLSHAVTYETKITESELFNNKKPDQEDFREHYKIAKNRPVELSLINFENYPTINSFIKLFESNEPKNSK